MATRRADAVFESMFRRPYGSLCRLACRFTGEPALAEDAVHDVFSAVGLRWTPPQAELDTPEREGAYLRTAVRNRCWQLRAKRTNSMLPLDEHEGAIGHVGGEGDALALEAELLETIHATVQRLSPQQRRIFALRRAEGLTTAATAECLGVASNTVENHLGRALRTIAEALSVARAGTDNKDVRRRTPPIERQAANESCRRYPLVGRRVAARR